MEKDSSKLLINEHPLLLNVADYEEQTGFTFESYIEALRARSLDNPSPPARKQINKGTKAKVWAKTDGHCFYCGIRLNPFDNFHVDHRVPFSQGGQDNIDNYVPSCVACNLSKGNRLC